MSQKPCGKSFVSVRLQLLLLLLLLLRRRRRRVMAALVTGASNDLKCHHQQMPISQSMSSVCTKGCGSCLGVSQALLPLPRPLGVATDAEGLKHAFTQTTRANGFRLDESKTFDRLFTGSTCVSGCELDLRLAVLALLQQRQQIPPAPQDAGKAAETDWLQLHRGICSRMQAVWKNISKLRQAAQASIDASNSTLQAPAARLHVKEDWFSDGREPYWHCCGSEK